MRTPPTYRAALDTRGVIEEEVLAIRDKSTAVMLPLSSAREVARKRGYDDIDPERCWPQWQRVRTQLRDTNSRTSYHHSSMPVPDNRIIEWLGNDSQGVPYYLHPLNLVWSDAGVEHDLEHYRQVADQLAAEPTYWAEILRDAAWRPCLAGCTCLLASRRHQFFEDLCCRFRAGSFVAPQIAVTLGLLHGSVARPFFESILNEPVFRAHPKQAVSAYRALVRLGAQPAYEISLDAWRDFERDDAMIADKVVTEHWDFWSSRV